MAQVEVLLPKMGESVAEATITKWLKAEGDTIEAEESLVEIATDKVDSEVPAPADGVIVKLLAQEGDVVEVGKPIAIISTDGETVAPTSAPAAEPTDTVAQKMPFQPQAVEAVTDTVVSTTSVSDRFYSPLVKTIASKEGIAIAELDTVSGSGHNGRVTKKDILAYVENRGQNGASAPAPVAQTVATAVKTVVPAKSYGDNVEIIEMDRMRKLIANHMVNSMHTSPHVTSMVEVDVTNLVNWRNNVKDKFLKKEGEKLTFTPLFIEAITKAIKDFPMINVSLDGDNIIRKKDINIGMAAALPSGNLIVPVIKNADHYNLTGLAKKVNDLASRARAGKLSPDEIQGGTYTMTNVGTFGNVMGTPIINQPQVAIMAVGAIRKKPAVIETPQGDTLGIRQMMFLSHSYDHRVVDGALGGSFVRRVADYLEQFDVNREI
ncbi:MAG: 2-oxo acid dehydrogenase subunit E2 [Flavobacteriales bacterium]|nr:2-oxo acid dehydrogenase subunit E2 [Flavobacteriales bacterium]